MHSLKYLILGLSGIFVLFAGFGSAAELKPRIVCYYGSWSNAMKDIPVEKCTHIYYSFLLLNETTWRYRFAGDEISERRKMAEFLNLRQNSTDAKFLLAIGGAAEGSAKYSNLAEFKERRTIFIESVVELLTEFKFDGVDVDWEFPGVFWEGAGQLGGGRPIDKRNLALFVEELRKAFDQLERPLEITMAVGVLESFITAGYDVPRLCSTLDAVHVMTYALRGSWDGVAEIHSLMYPRPTDVGEYRRYNTEGGSLLFSEYGCPKHKLIVGVAFFGHSFVLWNELNNKPGDLIDQEATIHLPGGGYMTYSEICQTINEGNWTRVFDAVVQGPYATKGDLWVGYDDVESIGVKIDWLKNHSFGGAMTWAIEEDDHKGLCGPKSPLITTMYDRLKDYVVVAP